jgi:hypothetical protein
MWVLFGVVLILFSIVKTKIVHYSSLCYFPLTFLAAWQVSRIDDGKVHLKRWVLRITGFTGVLLSIAIMLLPLVGIWKDRLIPYIDDEFAVANLQAAVNWSYLECLYGGIYLAGIIVTLVWLKRNFQKGMLLLISLQLFIIQVAMNHFVPKVEAYSQKAAVDFYKSLAGQDVYLAPLDFVSYGYLFYSEKQPSTQPAYYEQKREWLLNGAVDKPVYFITKITSEPQWSAHPNLVKLGEQNGFVFYKRR